jgi:hypothetical protein
MALSPQGLFLEGWMPMNTGSKKSQPEVGSTFCGSQADFSGVLGLGFCGVVVNCALKKDRKRRGRDQCMLQGERKGLTKNGTCRCFNSDTPLTTTQRRHEQWLRKV